MWSSLPEDEYILDCIFELVGCRRDIHNVFINTPYDKQVMMFTATLPAEAKATCLKYMNNVNNEFDLFYIAFMCWDWW